MRGVTAAAISAIAAAAAGGCLDELDPVIAPEVMCEIQEDCDTAVGEVCDEGICWGNPPESASFAAVLIPPDDRADLAMTEIAELSVDPDGTVHGLEFVEAVEIRGRVVLACEGLDDAACLDDESIPARIHVSRPSAIPGGPPFSRTITASGGVAAGDDAFSFSLPPVAAGEKPYEVTIRPADPGAEMQADSTLEATAPPLRTTLDAEADRKDLLWVVGDPTEHVEVAGRVVDAAGRGLAGHRIYAVGRWPGAQEDERISTTDITSEHGVFRLAVPTQVEGVVDVVARPPPDAVAPRLRLEGIELPDSGDDLLEPITLDDIQMPSYPSPAAFALPIDGPDTTGGKVAIEGARVTMETVLPSEPGIVATFTATSTTDEDGVAVLDLIPAGDGNRAYHTRISPPASSRHASSENVEIAVGPGTSGSPSFLAGVTLERRVLVDGEAVDSAGRPVAGGQIEARLSTSLSWMLDPATRALVSDRQLPTAATDDGGQFALWLDPRVAERPAVYDLAVVPPARLRAPRWSIDGLEAGGDKETLSLGSLKLPRASHARGVIEADGVPVAGAELRLYELGMAEDACESTYAPGGDDCEPPARLRGLQRADDDGYVWLVLPAPR